MTAGLPRYAILFTPDSISADSAMHIGSTLNKRFFQGGAQGWKCPGSVPTMQGEAGLL
jgi:hypothetical protein